MPVYTPLTEVMPVASMVTGAVVTSALGDQIRANLVALYDGWWFRAGKSTTTSVGASAYTQFVFDSITMSRSATDDGKIVLTGGAVVVTKPGLWVVGGNFSLSSANLILCTVGATNTASGFVCESGSDTASTKVDLSCSGGLQVDSTSTIVLYAWSGGSESIAPNAHSISPVLWGYWLGDNP